jgi:hypothetical protein
LKPEEKKEVEDTVEYLKNDKFQMTKMIKYKFDLKQKNENAAFNDPENMELQEKAARA